MFNKYGKVFSAHKALSLSTIHYRLLYLSVLQMYFSVFVMYFSVFVTYHSSSNGCQSLEGASRSLQPLSHPGYQIFGTKLIIFCHFIFCIHNFEFSYSVFINLNCIFLVHLVLQQAIGSLVPILCFLLLCFNCVKY